MGAPNRHVVASNITGVEVKEEVEVSHETEEARSLLGSQGGSQGVEVLKNGRVECQPSCTLCIHHLPALPGQWLLCSPPGRHCRAVEAGGFWGKWWSAQ